MMIFSWLNATKNLWMVGLILVGSAGLFAAYKNYEAKRIAAAVEATKAAISAGAVAAATKTAEAANAAEASTPLPADKQAVLALCQRSASCRERVR